MSTLYLIRHGQASFGAADYDVLSPLGQAQSEALGAFLAGHLGARGASLDAVYTGPRRRQRDTTRHLLASARAAGAAFPDAVELADLDEYPAFELLAHWMPELARTDPELAALLAPGALSSAPGAVPSAPGAAPPASRERAGLAFQALFARWARGELDTGALETFAAFSARVRRGVARVIDAEGRGKRVAIVTSGGPISIAVQMALGIADERTIEVAWVLANASVSEFRYRGAPRLSLVSFNGVAHLAEPALITYR